MAEHTYSDEHIELMAALADALIKEKSAYGALDAFGDTSSEAMSISIQSRVMGAVDAVNYALDALIEYRSK